MSTRKQFAEDFIDAMNKRPPTPVDPIDECVRLTKEVELYKTLWKQRDGELMETLEDAVKIETERNQLKRDLTALRSRLATCEAALHQCYAATGEEAGDSDDFRALVDRERITVEAVTQMRKERDAAQEDTARLDWLDAEHHTKNGLPIAALVVKVNYKRDSSEWANVAGNIRAAIDAARQPEATR